MNNLDDTQPRLPISMARREMSGPPRWLLWSAVGLLVLIVIGGVGSIVIFREVLRPSQQQRVIDQLPFMHAFLRPTPSGGTLPTPLPDAAGAGDALDLLQIDLALPSASPTAEATTEATTLPTETAAALIPTASPTIAATNPPPATPTLLPTATPEQAAQPVLPQTSLSVANTLPASARMFGFRHFQQSWNNCGPTNATMALSYFGWQEDQTTAERFLKPNREDKNVSPPEIANFINTQTGVRAMVRVGGTIDLLKSLVANNFPVIVETSAMFEAYDWIGHYRTLVAYDDVLRVFYVYDSFLGVGNGEGVTISYDELDEVWKHFNRIFIVIYQQQDEGKVSSLLGNLADERQAAEEAFVVAQQEATQNRQDAFAWFNMGTSLVILERYQEAASAFDRARQLNLPWRILWYQFGLFQAYYEMGRYDDILSLTQSNLINAQELEESYYWQGRAYAALGRTGEAATAFRTALIHNPLYADAQQALDALQEG